MQELSEVNTQREVFNSSNKSTLFVISLAFYTLLMGWLVLIAREVLRMYGFTS